MRSPASTVFAVSLLVTALAGCVTSDRAGPSGVPAGSTDNCATAQVKIFFDFSNASPARCVIDGVREFTLVFGPEHIPPINPSPWYAFRYEASADGPVTVRLAYLEAEHRYTPKLTRGGAISILPVSVAVDRRSATVSVPAGSGIVSAQPIIDARHYAEFANRMTREFGGKRLDLGYSLDGNPIQAMRFGEDQAPQLIVILGRQHPPEVTGSYALEPFLEELARALNRNPQLRARYQILAVPLLNPDGVDHGHWRANRGGVDLNRDWGPFTQPETRAVRDWMASHAALTRPLAMIDFHSTGQNLFYVQGDEASDANTRFLDAWLTGKEQVFEDYAFTIQKRNANPGSGTSKNWFFQCFAIPAYTYEVGDDAEQSGTETAARILARDFLTALPELDRSDAGTPKATGQTCTNGVVVTKSR